MFRSHKNPFVFSLTNCQRKVKERVYGELMEESTQLMDPVDSLTESVDSSMVEGHGMQTECKFWPGPKHGNTNGF